LTPDQRPPTANPVVADAAFTVLWQDPRDRVKLAQVVARYLRRHCYRTPYPPNMVWEPQPLHVVQRAWRERLAAPLDGSATPPLGLYLHVPYCSVKCQFCNCESVTDARAATHARYLRCLAEEIRLLDAPRGAAVDTVMIGGGTPTLLRPDHLDQLFTLLETEFDLDGCRERQVELSPFGCPDETIAVLAAHGIDRIKMGVQTVDPALLRSLRRPQDRDEVRRIFQALRAAGIPHLSVDLLVGLPGQSLDVFHRDLEFALSLDPDSLSINPFACIESTPFIAAGGRYSAEDRANREHMIREGHQVILDQVFPGAEGHSAVAMDASQVLDLEYRGGSILGLGYSARSTVRDRLFYETRRDHDHYVSRLLQRRFPDVVGWPIQRSDNMRTFVVDHLETHKEISRAVFRQVYSDEIDAHFADEIALARRAGLLEDDGDRLFVPPHPDDHQVHSTICGKLFYSRRAMAKVWALVAESMH